MIDVGIVGVGTYLPEKTMKAAEIARLTNGLRKWEPRRL